MLAKNSINFYRNKIDLKQVISDNDLESTDAAVFVCDLNDLTNKYELWKQLMPRIKPYYGEYY